MNTKNTAYWACQVLGWGSYTAIGVALATREAGPTLAVLLGFAAFFTYSIGLTHLLRREIKRRGWLSMPFRRSIPRFFGATVLTGLTISALVVVINAGLERRLSWDAQAISVLASSVTMFTIGWAVLYVAITSTRSALQGRLALREAELRALEGQVNPHFLFNCLNTIRGMISENPAQAQDMVTRLANIFRYNLQQHREHTVPLSQEIEIVKDYLALEAIRFEDRLRVSFSIEPAAANMQVPGMLLQTLVENALKHGLAKLPEGGELSIRATINGGELILKVQNTGTIVPEETSATKVGLKNARERLRLLYGARASLSLTNGNGRVTAAVLIPKRMKSLIVDDERIARAELRRLLAAHPEIEIVGEARNGEEALAAIAQFAPELVFLDIQMPGMTGFELLEKLEDVPQVIFTTAYDEYAIKAFEVNALDYLMKPIAPERLAASLRKVKLTASRSAAAKPLDQVFVRDGERCWIVRIADLYLLESEGNYTRLYFGRFASDATRPLIARSLTALEQRLDPAVFFRAGRKHIVNLKWIDRVETGVADNLVVTLKTGQTVEMSRRQSARLKDAISL